MAESIRKATTPGADLAAADVAANVADTARILMAAGSVTATLNAVAELAVVTIAGCERAGVLFVKDPGVPLPSPSDQVVREMDDLQHRSGEGPSMDAISQQLIVSVDDLGGEPRWPAFASYASKADIWSMVAIPLPDAERAGALNVYASSPGAFGMVDQGRAVVLASLAALALSAARTLESEERRADNLRAALITREVIGQAQGILMQREGVTAEVAFDILRKASQHLNLKLRQVAQQLVDTGEGPNTGPAPEALPGVAADPSTT
jgi:ANTAR domain/GAF domain